MLECIKFGDCKVRSIQIGDECFVAIKAIGIARGVNESTLKSIVRNHLPSHLRLTRKDIGLDITYHKAKLFTTVAGACRVVLTSTHPDKYEVIDFLLARHDQLQENLWNLQKKVPHAHSESIPSHISSHVYFIIKLGIPAILGKAKIAYQYACLRRNLKQITHSMKEFHNKHPDSKVVLKMVNDPISTWKSNRSISTFRHYFNINKGHHDILVVEEVSN